MNNKDSVDSDNLDSRNNPPLGSNIIEVENQRSLSLTIKKDNEEEDKIPSSHYLESPDIKITTNEERKSLTSLVYFHCKICLKILKTDDKWTLCECYYMYCDNCMFEYIKFKIQNNQVLEIICPNENCNKIISEELIESIISPALFEKYILFRNNDEFSKNPLLRWCPKPDCQGYDTGCLNKNKLICNVCQFQYCYYCGEEWHSTTKCKANIDKEFDKWAKTNGLKYCPSCRRKVEKIAGCDHMTCIKCKYQWCWLCGEPYTNSHGLNCVVYQHINSDPPLLSIFAKLFAPVLLLFISVIISFILLKKLETRTRSKLLRDFIKNTWISYPIIGLVGLILSPIFFALAPFIFSIILSIKFLKDCCCIKVIRILCSFIVGIIFVPIFLWVVIIGVYSECLIGFFSLIYKLYICIRRCWDPRYLLLDIKYGLI